MAEDNVLKLTAELNESGTVANGQISPDMREDFKRGDVRLSLQAASLSAAPTASGFAAPPPIALYTRPETAQKKQPANPASEDDLEGVSRNVSQNPASEQALTDYFRRWGQDDEVADLRIDFNTLSFTLSLYEPVPQSQTQPLNLVLADGAEQIIELRLDVIQAVEAAAIEDEESAPTIDEARETPQASTEEVTLDLNSGTEDAGLQAVQTTLPHLVDLISEAIPISSVEGLLVPLTSSEEMLGDSPSVSPSSIIEAQTETEVPPPPRPNPYTSNAGIIFEGERFGAVDLTGQPTGEKIYLTDSDSDDVTARFVRDAQGVKFLITLDGVAEQTASIYGYVPIGTDVSLFDRNGDPIDVTQAVYVYENNSAVLTGGTEDNILLGGDQDEALRGRRGDDILLGGAGDDRINAGRGHDVLDGGQGNDRLKGGPGDDSFYFSGDDFGSDLIVEYEAGDTLHLLDVAADDVYARYIYEDGAPYLLLSIHSEQNASANIRIDVGPDAPVAIYDQTGNPINIVSPEVTFGNSDSEYLLVERYGEAAMDDLVSAGDGDDFINDFGGNNTLLGNDGNDSIFGGDAVDWIDGGTGDDHLSGGGGADIFVFTGDDFGHDTIWDYEAGDVVVLADMDVGDVRARFEVQGRVMQLKILTGDAPDWTASISFYASSRDEDYAVYLADGIPLLPEAAIHHISEETAETHRATQGTDVFHLGTGATDIVAGFDADRDRIGLDVSDALLAEVQSAHNDDAMLSILGEALGLSITDKADPTAQRTDTVISFHDEVALILEDVEDELDITQFDIY